MLLFLSAQHLLIRAALRKRIERRLQFAAGGFEPDIRQITLRLRGTTGANGGVDKLCMISARLRNGKHLRVSKMHPDLMAAIGGALRRLRHALFRRVAQGMRKTTVDLSARSTDYWIG